MSKIENLIYKMLTTNTGIHMCDSGGENGRLWQRNQKKTIDDFRRDDEASIEISLYKDNEAYAIGHVSLFHYLVKSLSLDDLCDKFNRKKVTDWDGEFYGTSESGAAWIRENFTTDSESWNSYNWDCPLSQTVQGINLIHNDTDENYVLLQIHNGADVRGGYTDAKLFKLDNEAFMIIDLYADNFALSDNSLIDDDGTMLNAEETLEIARDLGVTNDKSVTVNAIIGGF